MVYTAEVEPDHQHCVRGAGGVGDGGAGERDAALDLLQSGDDGGGES